jgi:hypothetical protein
MDNLVLSKYTEDFVRVALEYCVLVEKTRPEEKQAFVESMLKVLPLLYLKISVIPPIEEFYDSDLENRVNEELYSKLELNLSEILGEDNLYLETFHPDINLSDSPIAVKISEDLADIYQDIGNFIAIFKNGQKETMNDSLVQCIENFKKYWGQHLVNALRALHHIQYREEIEI